MQRYPTAPHQGHQGVPTGSPNAALLIDFDNVTMGIRSDLTRQLKELLNSDIIKGKVAVQRAYADWRRYAQYIVPLSEASVDLIFAPAYGSSKKNATDIRLAIDALELVFTRPEIGVFILLSGDSDFSSLVLKLKEYGKYVVGVGLRESASDLLVQNCDEYFSYSSLTGLTRAGEEETISAINPWDLAERSVRQMANDNDVMRSDRLKQVMLELDPSFDEAQLGYSKFNRFLTEAASKNKLALKKLDNGQYEVQPLAEGAVEAEPQRPDRSRGRGRREPRREEPRQSRAAEPRQQEAQPERAPEPQKPTPRPATRERRDEQLQHGYELLQKAVRELTREGGAARDSDIKRQMLELESGWDEAEIGFTKFSRFLRQAHSAEVIDLRKSGEGYYEATLPRGAGAPVQESRPRGRSGGEEREDRGGRDRGRGRGRGERDRGGRDREQEQAQVAAEAETAEESQPREAVRTERGRQEPAREERKSRTERQKEATVKSTADEAPAGRDAAASTPAAEKSQAAQSDKAEEQQAEAASTRAEAPAAKAPQRSVGRGVGRGRRGAPDGPPPLLPGQAVGGTPVSGDSREEKGTGGRGPDEGRGKPARTEPKQRAQRAPVETPAAETPVATPDSPSKPVDGADRAAADSRPEGRERAAAEPAPGAGAAFDASELGLPTDSVSVIRYLSNSYPGVGQKTAETLISTFGAERVFHGLHSDQDRVREMLGSGRRTEALLEAWQKDFRRRTTAGSAGSPATSGGSSRG